MAKYLTRTPSTTGNRKTWTFSAWLKRGRLGSTQCFMGSNEDSPFQFDGSDQLLLVIPASTQTYKTNRVYRDSGAWYHIVVACDTTQATASNRLKVYTNGVLETSLAISTYPNQNIDTGYNTTSYKMFLGANRDADIAAFDGEMSDFYWVDGQALGASVFGETSSTTGQWVPKAPSVVKTGVGSFGTNGCYLPFSTKTSTTTLGYDYKAADRSGTLCDWTLNNMSTSDGLTDGYDANFAILSENYSKGGTNTSITQAGLQWNFSNSSGRSGAVSTMNLPRSGKWFFEFRGTAMSGSQWWGGITRLLNHPQNAEYPGYYSGDYTYGNNSGEKSNNGTQASYGASWTTNDVIGVLADADNGTVTFYKNGSSQGVAYSSINMSSADFAFIVGSGATSATMEANFGQGTFVTSNSGAGYSDANGRGKFQYAVPSGALSLCEKNITNPTITKPNLHFDAITYTGTGSYPRAVTGLAFQPDFVWLKNRSAGYYHQTYDAVRGTGTGGGVIYTNVTDQMDDTYKLTSFDSTGFTLSSSLTAVNASNEEVVALCWKAGNGTVSNTAGTVTSTVSANTTAGFSVVKYNTGSNSNAFTVGHGLNAVPKFIIIKGAYNSTTYNWDVYHVATGAGKRLILNSNAGEQLQPQPWDNQTPSSTLIYQNNSSGTYYGTNKDMIAYCWAEVEGFSKFGYYVGNGIDGDGTMVQLGFKPRFVMVKRIDSTGNWCMFDSARSPRNTITSQLFANDAGSESSIGSANFIEFYSNGFKLKNNATDKNGGSNAQYAYMAWAEAPLDFANSR